MKSLVIWGKCANWFNNLKLNKLVDYKYSYADTEEFLKCLEGSNLSSE